MTGLEPLITGLAGLALETVKETAKEESGSSLAKWLKTDVGRVAEQAFFRASRQYVDNYRERHGKLKVTCVRMDTPIDLEEIYTAVQLLDRSDLQYFESTESLQNWFRESGKRGFRIGDSEKQDGIAVANKHPYLLVLGGPGVGKSTFLRKVGLEALKPQRQVGIDGYPLSKYQHSCIPVFLALQRFKSTDRTIEQRIAEEFATCGFPESEAFTQAMLKKGRLLVLLDGLDEVPTEQEDAVIEQIRDFVDLHQNNRFIASCRIAAYKGGFPRFKDVAMAGFEDDQIKQFIHNWFQLEKDRENHTAEQCWERLQRPEYAAAKELAQTPLLLTLLCAVYDKSLELPKNRAALYGEALDVVLKEWAAEKRLHRDPIYQDFPIELERELLAELAYDSFINDHLFFDKRDVTRRIKEFLISNLNAPEHLDGESVLEAIEIQQGILVERARDIYSFSHLTFQEYLTAQHIVDNQQIESLVKHHLTDQHWREVFLLVAGLMPGRKGADELLLTMEKQTQIDSVKLNALIGWAQKATAALGAESADTPQPAAKRVGAIYLARILDLARARKLPHDSTYDFVHDFTHDLARFLNLAPTQDLTQALCLNLNLNVALVLASAPALELARQFQKIGIFPAIDFARLAQQLEALQLNAPDVDQPTEVRQAFFDRLKQVWFEALQLDPKIAALTREETQALNQYLYANELMVRCKEAAVRVSPDIWTGIEQRMLTVCL